MDNNNAKKSKLSFGSILYWTIGILLALTMLSTWLMSDLFARYVVDGAASDSARVAAGGDLKLLEHKAELKGGIYVLTDDETNENTYSTVIPGVDIAKDPHIELDLDGAEVDYELYIQVKKSDYFPDTVTYELTGDWEEVDEVAGIYKYKSILDAGTQYDEDIRILEDDKLYVSEHYVGKDADGKKLEFSLSFNAWLKQAD